MNLNPSKTNAIGQLDALLGLFYSADSMPGTFAKVDAESLPSIGSRLLAHDHHMTVTLESHHDCPVDVQVLDSRTDGDRYSRKIILTRQSDGEVVMFGIVRMDRTVFAADVRDEIESQRTPLGRVLIDNNVLRTVKLMDLYRIEASGDLAASFKMPDGSVCCGRTAMIYCDGAEAIELLEIVKPDRENRL